MAIAGLDIGTTGCKCTVYDRSGQLLSEAYREYPARETADHGLDASVVWECTKAVLKEAAGVGKPIAAIGITSFGEAAVLLDRADAPLAFSLLYTDPRGKEQCERLAAHFGGEELFRSTGLKPSPMYTIPKLMHIRENHPGLFAQCERICLFADYMVYMLSGVRQVDYSSASRTMAFDIHTLQWNEAILAFAGISRTLLPAPVPIGTRAGPVRREWARELGLSEDTVIVSGCHDQLAAAIGTGAYKPGMAVDGTGTVECITPVFGTGIRSHLLYSGSYAMVPFLNGQLATYAFSFTSGALLKWYRDKLAAAEADAARGLGINPYEFFNGQVDAASPSGLLVLPHFSGAATPYMDPESRGAVIGLTTETTSRDIYQALMEGVTYEMALNLEQLSAAGIEIRTIRATGGGALSDIWLQMKADIWNLPVVSLGAAQSGTLGCIMLAGAACGIYGSVAEAERIFVKAGRTYAPDPARHEIYRKWYRKYKKCYEAVKTILAADREE
ncbi:MAG: hypothetical protein K0R57_193 [Paenibacillaceae bacterium]|nr:hypothetical protein [Paenibacillaceae bacterium]